MREFAGTCLLTAARFQPPAPVPPETSIVPLTARITCAAGAVIALDLGARFGEFRFLIRDRGSNFTRSFDAVFEAAGATIVLTAVQAPRMNATGERLIGTPAPRVPRPEPRSQRGTPARCPG
jgi:hypothetical protein